MWFFAFTAVGLAMMIFMAILRRTLGLNWKDGLLGAIAIGLFALVSRG